MSAPLHLVTSPGDQDVLLYQARQLRVLTDAHAERGAVLREARVSILRDLEQIGLTSLQIALRTGDTREAVEALLAEAAS